MAHEEGARPSSVEWWGHATVAITIDGTRVVTDPLLRRRVGPLHSRGHRPDPYTDLSDVDAVLLSHLHRDHTDLPSIRRFPSRSRVLVPVGAGTLLRRNTRSRVSELAVGGSTRIGSVTVTATAADHDGSRHRGGPRAAAVGYLLSGSSSVYFAGDTDVFPGMADIAASAGDRLDVALLPVSGWGLTLGDGHMDPHRAAEAVRLLRPRLAVPIHWGTLRIPVAWRARRHLMGVAELFAELVAGDSSNATTVVVPTPGVPIEVPSFADRERR